MTDLESAYSSVTPTEIAGLGYIGGRSTVWATDELVSLRSPPSRPGPAPSTRVYPIPYAPDLCRYTGVYRVGAPAYEARGPGTVLLEE